MRTLLLAAIAVGAFIAPAAPARGVPPPGVPAEEDAAALLALIDALRDPDEEIQIQAAALLPAMGRSATGARSLLLAALGAGSGLLRAHAAAALGSTGFSPESASALASLVGDDDASVAWAAASALGFFGPEASGALPALIAAFRRGHFPGLFPEAMARIHRPAAVEAMAEALQDLGDPGRGALPALLPLLSDPNVEVRAEVARALAGIGAEAGLVVPALAEAVARGWPVGAAETLGRFGPAAHVAVPVLVRALRDPNPEMRARAAGTLGRIDASGACGVLAGALADPEAIVREAAAEALWTGAGDLREALRALAGRRQDPSVRVRVLAARAAARLARAERR